MDIDILTALLFVVKERMLTSNAMLPFRTANIKFTDPKQISPLV